MTIPYSFMGADVFLGARGVRNVKGKRATQIVRLGPDEIALRYHGTSVVTWSRSGDVTLRTNGHHTVTTKRRINDASPVRVYQKNFQWYCIQSSKIPPIPFEEGMVVRSLNL